MSLKNHTSHSRVQGVGRVRRYVVKRGTTVYSEITICSTYYRSVDWIRDQEVYDYMWCSISWLLLFYFTNDAL